MICFVKNSERKCRVKRMRSEKDMSGDLGEDITMLRICCKNYFQFKKENKKEIMTCSWKLYPITISHKQDRRGNQSMAITLLLEDNASSHTSD